ncbi:SIMPL domain-containing protein [bacterium]|nr:SIMPL domain-containing protein [bacterium]
MKKITVLLLSLLMTVFVGTKVFAEQGYITVSASSQTELAPNVISFDVEIVTTSKDSMQKAVAENKTKSEKVYNTLKKLTENNKEDSIKTSTYNATPVYRYNNNKRVLDYYQVTNSVKVRTTQVSEAGKMIDSAIASGATSVNNVSYNVSAYENETNKLLADATKKARAQADSIAKALGTEVSGVKSVSISTSVAGQTNTPRLYLAKANGTAETADTTTNIEVGTMTLNARVNINFYIK